MKALIDGDIVTFRAAFTAENDPAWVATSRTDTLIDEILESVGATEFEVWLSGSDNFRYGVYPEYKANRLASKRPKWEHEVKQHLVDHWDAKWSEGCEADDMLGVQQTNETIICTIDKDLNMIPGWHYNFVKKDRYYVTEDEAIRFFYYQLLVGDTADGIKGVPGIGPVKANRLLDSVEEDTEEEYFQVVREQYSSDMEMEMNGKVLWIWRKMNDIWRMPNE